MRPTAIDIFAGVGGLALGFEQAGFDVLASVEYDAVHAATHKYNFPLTATLCRDVSKMSGSELVAAAYRDSGFSRDRSSTTDIDVIFGGPPCQGFSLIGKRLVEDERNQLVFHFVRLVSEIRPKYFVLENVPGMAVGGHNSILQALVREFKDINYIVSEPVRILNAMNFGVPQDRKRLFILGARADQAALSYPEATYARNVGSDQVAAFGMQPVPTVWSAIGDLPNLDTFDELVSRDAVELRLNELADVEESASDYVRSLRLEDEDKTNFAYRRIWNRAALTSSMRTEHTELSVSRFSATPPGSTEPVSRFLRLRQDGVCNTLRAGTGSERGAYTSPRPIHPVHPRVISVREAARLHSFPDWFRFHQTKWHGFRQIGNSVPPLLGRAVASQIIKALGISPTKPHAELPLMNSALLTLSMDEAAQYFGADLTELPKRRLKTHQSSK